MTLVTKPFSFLASALGAESGTDEMGYVKFLPGKADLIEENKKTYKKVEYMLWNIEDILELHNSIKCE